MHVNKYKPLYNICFVATWGVEHVRTYNHPLASTYKMVGGWTPSWKTRRARWRSRWPRSTFEEARTHVERPCFENPCPGHILYPYILDGRQIVRCAAPYKSR